MAYPNRICCEAEGYGGRYGNGKEDGGEVPDSDLVIRHE